MTFNNVTHKMRANNRAGEISNARVFALEVWWTWNVSWLMNSRKEMINFGFYHQDFVWKLPNDPQFLLSCGCEGKLERLDGLKVSEGEHKRSNPSLSSSRNQLIRVIFPSRSFGSNFKSSNFYWHLLCNLASCWSFRPKQNKPRALLMLLNAH